MTTVLTEFSNNGNSRTSTLAGHTAVKPQLVIEKRKIAEGNQRACEYSGRIVLATKDANDVILPQKVSLEVTARYPIDGVKADRDLALAYMADIVTHDEMANTLETLEWL